MASAEKVFRQTIPVILLGLQVFALLTAAVAGDSCRLEPDCACAPGFGVARLFASRLGAKGETILSPTMQNAGDGVCTLCQICLGPFTEAISISITNERQPRYLFCSENRMSYQGPVMSQLKPPS